MSTWELRIGHVLEHLHLMPDESVHCCVTSPPYYNLRDYKVEPSKWGDGWVGCLGLEPTPEQFVDHLVEVFTEVKRVLRADGTLWVNLGDSYATSGGHRSTAGSGLVGTPQHLRGAIPGTRVPPAAYKAKDLYGIPWKVAQSLRRPYHSGLIKDERDRVWLAAMIDGEGCIFVHKRKEGQSNGQGYFRKNATYEPGLEISSTDRVIVERILAITRRGSICEQTPKQNDRRKQRIYRWNLRSNECRDVIREIYPHLVAKQHEARLAFACPPSGPEAAYAHESLKAIHQGGDATIDFSPPLSMFEPGWYLRSEIIWAKPNAMPSSVIDRPTNAHETIFLLAKQSRYFYDAVAIREPDRGTDHPRRVHEEPSLEPSGGLKGKHTGLRSAEGRNGMGANKRSVWTVGTVPYPEGHFATYPPGLIEPMILAGAARKVCSKCGKPWERLIERTAMVVREGPSRAAGRIAPGNASGSRTRVSGTVIQAPSVTTKGFAATCDCDASCVPSVVLDPFVGSGTTIEVGVRNGRNVIGIDVDPSNKSLVEKRMAGVTPSMFDAV